MNATFLFSSPLYIPVLHHSDCNFAGFCRLIAIFLQSSLIPRAPLFSTIYPISITSTPPDTLKQSHITPKSTFETKNIALSTRHPLEIVKNKTRRNYNLYTVNKIQQAPARTQAVSVQPATEPLRCNQIDSTKQGTSMAKFWFVSAPLYSHTDWGGFRKTAQALHQQGHEIIWVSEAPLAAAIERNGLRFEAIAKTGWLWPPPPPPDLTGIPAQEAVMLRYRRALDTWLSEDLVATGVEELVALAERTGKPDAIVTDPFLSAVAFAAEKLAVPMMVAGWPAQANLDENQMFPVQRDLSSDSQQRIQRLCDKFGLQGDYFSKGAAPSIVSPYLHLTYFTPDWYMGEATMMLPQTQFVGGTKQLPVDAPPAWLDDIPEDKPLALITLGTIFSGDLGFFSWAAQAVARAGLIPVVVLGWNPIEPDKKAELKRALPGGTRLLNWAPFEHVLPRCKIMIHHGGMGTTHYAIVHGVPQIVVPHAADQRIQGRRVSQVKIGLNLTAHDVRQGQLWEGVNAIMEAEWVQENATHFAEQMAAYGGISRAAELILQALETAQ